MTESVVVTGIVIASSSVGEYDKRLVILTKERGKITAFARGAKRAKSMFMAGSRLFSFGEFTLYPGKDAYSINKMEIQNYFTEISNDIEATCFGCYFLELADYFSRENIEATETIKLIYQTLRALMNKKIPNKLIRYIYELKILTINGEYPQMFECVSCQKDEILYFSAIKGGMMCGQCSKKAGDCVELDASTIYTMQYVISATIEKLYTFVVNDKVLHQMEFIMKRYFRIYVNQEFKSLEILNSVLK